MDIQETERKKSIDYLVSIGMLLPLNGLKLYHGRSAKNDNGVEWKVNKGFNNSGNETGNRNVNVISALSTSDYETAKEFADERNNYAYTSVGKPIDASTSRVYRIISSDKDAMIFNARFDYSKISKEELSKCFKALKALTEFSLSEMVPAKFEDRNAYSSALQAIKTETLLRGEKLVSYDILNKVYNDSVNSGAPYSKELLLNIGGAFNTKQMLKLDPKYIVNKYITEENPVKRNMLDGYENFRGPLNMDYFSSWAYNNHIIGCKKLISSVTVGRNIDNYMIFDKSKINTEKALGDKYQSIMDKYGEISKIFDNFLTDEKFIEELKTSSPTEIIDLFKNKGFAESLKMDSGVWEKFSVGEHTETVLRVFDDSFNSDVPESMMPIMKFIILIHDIGKGYAFKDHGKNKNYEKLYTKSYCENYLFDKCGVEPKLRDLMLFIVGESQDYIDKIYLDVFKKIFTDEEIKAYKNKMVERTCAELQKVLNRRPTKNEVFGLIGMCKTLLICDGGAYTRYAVTRDEKNDFYYRNGNDNFTESFAEPMDIRRREIKFPEK